MFSEYFYSSFIFAGFNFYFAKGDEKFCLRQGLKKNLSGGGNVCLPTFQRKSFSELINELNI